MPSRSLQICIQMYYGRKSLGKIDTKMVGFRVPNTFVGKFANFAMPYFPHFTTFDCAMYIKLRFLKVAFDIQISGLQVRRKFLKL